MACGVRAGWLGAAVAVFLTGSAVSPQADDGAFGAVAIDTRSGFVAFAYGLASEAEALDKVKAECAAQKAACNDGRPFHDACVSLARSSDDQKYGLAVEATRAAAQETALGECSDHGGVGCNVHDTYCAPDGLDR